MVLPKEQHDTPEKARCRTELSVHKWRCMVECDVCGPVPESKSSKYSTFPLCEVTCTPKCKLKCAQNFPDEARAKCRLLHHKAFCKGECRYILKDFPLTFCDPPGGRLGLKRVVGKYLNLKPSSAKSRLKGRNYTKAAPNAQTCAYCRTLLNGTSERHCFILKKAVHPALSLMPSLPYPWCPHKTYP